MSSTSGRVNGGTYNGSRFYFQWQLASQSVGGNYSTINWQWGLNIDPGGYAWYTNAVKSVSGYIAGNLVFGSNTWSNISGTGDHQLLSGSINLGHDSNGNLTFSISNTGWLYSYGNVDGGSGTWSLPQIPRYANITAFNITQTTDEWVQFQWSADRTCDYVSWWSTAYDGGGHHDIPVSGSGVFSIDLHNLKSATQYDITVAVRNAASGLWTNSSPLYATTKAQNNFVGKRVI